MFDPKKSKKLTIFAAQNYPAWQEKYIDLVREEFERTKLSDEKELVAKVGKVAGKETKKAMPFVHGLKKRLIWQGEKPETVFKRKLAYDELATLKEMTAPLKRTTGCAQIEVVSVDEGGKTGNVVIGEGEGGKKKDLPQPAEAAVPGVPSFHFENIEG